MTNKELIDSGILHEANRLFFHPLGLALYVDGADDPAGEARLGLVDRRDDPAGIRFDDEALSPAKAAAVARLLEERAVSRRAELGYVVQPEEPGPPVCCASCGRPYPAPLAGLCPGCLPGGAPTP